MASNISLSPKPSNMLPGTTERQPSWIRPIPDNRIASCRFFWHSADFLDYIRQGVHIIYRDELALPVDWNDVQPLSQIWDYELKRDAYLLRRLAWSCLHAQYKSRSPRDPEAILPFALMHLALVGDGSDQIGGLINGRMVLDVYESRTLGWQRPIFSAVLFDGALEKLQRELSPMEG
ncbi:hypothetical protein DOTSEDRAFT_33814 [Dothistroma septosporum NZE10]|uniref:Uncharacterized protein n=1 Tax=Dothistroma septosporum (strain NZE10 / CBS 128990) TaxID=675120 RepID=N1PPF5_DOTSN|nr:hypothetical protein DOTSEDRAFT_33814 [Dothistroma septosporum NZE10]